MRLMQLSPYQQTPRSLVAIMITLPAIESPPPPPSSSATPESNYISAKPCFDVWWPTSTRERTCMEGERVRERAAYVSAAEARVDDDKRIRNTMRRVTSPPPSLSHCQPIQLSHERERERLVKVPPSSLPLACFSFSEA